MSMKRITHFILSNNHNKNMTIFTCTLFWYDKFFYTLTFIRYIILSQAAFYFTVLPFLVISLFCNFFFICLSRDELCKRKPLKCSSRKNCISNKSLRFSSRPSNFCNFIHHAETISESQKSKNVSWEGAYYQSKPFITTVVQLTATWVTLFLQCMHGTVASLQEPRVY